MRTILSVLQSIDVDEALREIDGVSAKGDQFAHAECMAIGDQDQRRVSMAVSADLASIAQQRIGFMRKNQSVSVTYGIDFNPR